MHCGCGCVTQVGPKTRLMSAKGFPKLRLGHPRGSQKGALVTQVVPKGGRKREQKQGLKTGASLLYFLELCLRTLAPKCGSDRFLEVRESEQNNNEKQGCGLCERRKQRGGTPLVN